MTRDDQALRFVTALYSPYQQLADWRCLRIEARPLMPKWKPVQTLEERRLNPREWFGLTHGGFEALCRWGLNRAMDWEMYVGVLPRIGRRGMQADVPLSWWIWADVDGGDQGPEGAVALVKAADIPRPHMAVMSGSGLHAYWRLSAAADVSAKEDRDRFKALLKRLCMAIGGATPSPHADSSRADTASILRLPGTYNNKIEGSARAVKLLRFDMGAELNSFTWWRAHLPSEPSSEIPTRNGYRPHPLPGEHLPIPPRTMEKIVSYAPEGSRHNTRRAIAVSLAKCGYNADDISNFLDVQAQSCGSPQGVEIQNRKLAQWAYQNAR